MRIATLCEFSGVVRDAFIKRGHYAISCDLLDSESSFGPHIKGDCFNYDWSNFDLILAFPSCTYLCSSGLHWNNKVAGRKQKTLDAVRFVLNLWSLPVSRIAIENPIGCLSTLWKKPDQIIQPWQFGCPESKKTCLWLKNLPLLIPTEILPIPKSGRWENQTPSGQNKIGPSENRWKLRSKTYLGIANAMAEQWSV